MEFEYKCENKYSFVDFMSNIGGLFGLWFGITFIDMSQLIRIFLRKIEYFIFSYINLYYILLILAKIKANKMMKILLDNLKILIVNLKNFNWKRIIQIISLPFIVYQIWKLTDNYLNFPTEVSVERIPNRDSLNRLSDESIPAITVCYEHIFERFLFDDKQKEYFNYMIGIIDKEFDIYYEDEKSYIINLKTKNYYIQLFTKFFIQNILGFIDPVKFSNNKIKFNKILTYYLDVNNETEFNERLKYLNDKTLNDLNGTKVEFDFFSFITRSLFYYENQYINSYEDSFNTTLEKLEILSPFGKCYTHLSNIKGSHKRDIPFDSVHLMTIQESRYREGFRNSLHYVNKKIFIHSSEVFPDLTAEEIQLTDNNINQLNDYTIFIERTDFKKLPKPYKTNCRNYGKSNRFHCLNNCYLKGYQNQWNCTPNDNHLITIVLKNGIIEPNVKFCYKDDNEVKNYNNYLRKYCFENCLESCDHTHFSVSIETIQKSYPYPINSIFYPKIGFDIKSEVYLKIIFSPQILFLDFVICIVNILSLWHGVYILNLVMKLINFTKSALTKLSLFITMNNIPGISYGNSYIKVHFFLNLLNSF